MNYMTNNSLEARMATPPPRALNITLWILQWALGISLIGAGVFKLALPPEQAFEIFPWGADIGILFTVTSIFDVLGGVGVILPALLKIAPRLTPIAAAGVVALMLSSVVFYLTRGEVAEIVPNLVMAVIAAFIAWGRWSAAPITGALPVQPTWAGPLPAASSPAGMKLSQLPTGTYVTRGALAIRNGSFSDERHFASTALLVRHPKGDVLIDAGFGADADKHIEMLPSFRRAPHELGTTASDQLTAAGYDRSKLLGVILTHSHWDHVSGLDSLDVPVFLTADEEKYADDAKDDKVFAAVAAGHDIRRYTFEGPAYLGFPSSHDFYGDGSLVIVPAAGHTTGSVIVFVTLPSGERYGFIGDLTWQLEGITERLERPLMMRMLADSDVKQVRRDLARVISLAGVIGMVPAHDLRAYEGIPLLDSHPVDGGTR